VGASPPSDPEQQAQDAYLPVKDAQGNVTKTAVQVRSEDLMTLFYGIPASSTRVTRMRADLAHAALAADLIVSAAADQSVISNVRQLTNEINEPQCTIYNGCDAVGTAPRSQAVAESSGGNVSACAASPSPRFPLPAWIGALGGFLALVFVKTARGRRSAPNRGSVKNL
jgi:hypothetical protein